MTSGRPQPVAADRPDGVGRCSTSDCGRPLVVLASSPTDRGTADSRVRCAQQGQGMTWWHVARWDFVGSVAAPYAAARSVSPDAVAKRNRFFHPKRTAVRLVTPVLCDSSTALLAQALRSLWCIGTRGSKLPPSLLLLGCAALRVPNQCNLISMLAARADGRR